jgi:acyl-coenzyme A synthetase/AMP-(fatty) acid ligase
VEGEQPYVFVEVQKQEVIVEWGYELIIQIVQAIHNRLGIRPARVYLVKPRTIPKTHNGKIQHVLLREMYLNGTLREEGLILYPDY